MEAFVFLLGKNGIIGIVGLLVFLAFQYSKGLFHWLEEQTMGTRTYILEKCELMHIKVNPDKLTIWLLIISCGSGSLVFLLIGFLEKWEVGFMVGCLVSFLGFKLPKFVINILMKIVLKVTKDKW